MWPIQILKGVRLTIALLLLSSLLWPAVALARAPMGQLVNPKGQVELAVEGGDFKPIARNKFLFRNAVVKVGAEGSVTVIHNNTGMAYRLKPGAVAEVTADEAMLVEGNWEENDKNDRGLYENMNSLLGRAHRYAVVRRAAEGSPKTRLPDLTVTSDYPTVLWSNVAPTGEGRYLVKVGDATYTMPAPNTEAVTFDVPKLLVEPTPYEVVYVGKGQRNQLDKQRTLSPMPLDAEASLHTQLAAAASSAFPEFYKGKVYQEHNLLVPAMRSYQAFFSRYPEEHELRPLLIQIYRQLGMNQMATLEIERLNEAQQAE